MGDSAYPLKEWLIPPLLNPNALTEVRYNRAHKSTRRIIENAFGVLKERFACLKSLRVQPLEACALIKACCTLNNLCSTDICIENETAVNDCNELDMPVEDLNQQGINRRNNLIEYFVN